MTNSRRHPLLVLLALTPWLFSCNEPEAGGAPAEDEARQPGSPEDTKNMLVHYLEVVTPDVDATCTALEQLHGVRFGAPEPALGNARTAALDGGGTLGVRAPMRADEAPFVRPYVLTTDIDAAVEAARAAGAQIALPPMEIPGHGKCALYVHGGIEHGLWQR